MPQLADGRLAEEPRPDDGWWRSRCSATTIAADPLACRGCRTTMWSALLDGVV